MKKLIPSLAVSSVLLFACGNNEVAEVDDATEEVAEDKSLIVADSAKETAQNVADRYDYEMVEPVPNDTSFGIVDYWEFDKKHAVFANPDGGLMHVGGAGLTKEEALDLINNEDFPVTEELQSILDATSFDDFYDDGVSSEYRNTHDGVTLAAAPQFTSENDVLFSVVLSIEP